MLVYGRNVAEEYLKQPKKVRKVYLQEGFSDQNLQSLLSKTAIVPKFFPKTRLDQLATGLHQGIILDVEDFRYTDLEELLDFDGDGCLLILDHLEDPHNLGAIIRTAEAAGVRGIILPKDRSVSVNSTVIKTSVGAIENIMIAQVTNLSQVVKKLKDHGFWIVGTAMERSQDYRALDYRGKTALVIGNEGNGMTRIVAESCDFVAKIPMYGKVNSLNASVAAAIMIYEVVRQQRG